MSGDVEARLSALEWAVVELRAGLLEVAAIAGFVHGFVRGFVDGLVDANRRTAVVAAFVALIVAALVVIIGCGCAT